jgi:DNA-binding CsgD family transcriptional regulator/tetratricopeptide (TPR) repeat protein
MIVAMARRMTSPVLVGRSDEVGRIRAAFEASADGTPRHIVIGGEAGVGKSRMLAETGRIAQERGARVLLGGCVSMGDEGLPFAPYTEIIRGLVAADGVTAVQAVAGRAAPDLARIVPALGAAEEARDQELWAQTRLYEALLDLIRRLAERGPLVLQLEDLHWADAGTLAATSYLLRAVHAEPVTVVATFRSDEITRRHPLRPWLAEIARTDRVERIDLVPLEEPEVAALVGHITDGEVPVSELDDIVLRSDGNPFFIEELLAARVDGGATIPGELRDVLLSRVDGLPAETQQLLDIAAVGGRVVEHDTLAAVVGAGPAEMAPALRQLVESGLLVPTQALDGDDAYAFRHALLLEAVYEAMLPSERRQLHRRWGDALAAHDTAASTGAAYLLQIAHHWRFARDPRALPATIAAGDAAMRGYSFDTASREYEAALLLWDDDAPPPDSDHVELLERTARAAYLASRYRTAVEACQAAIDELGEADPARHTELLILLGRTQWVSGDWGGAVPTYERALKTAPDEPPIVLVKALAGLGQVYMLQARLPEARGLCEAAIQGAIDVGDRVLEGHGRNTLAVVLAGLGEIDEATDSIEAALRIALETRDADDIGRAYVNKCDIEFWAGYPERALASAVEGIRVAADWGVSASYGAFVGFGAATFAFECGRWQEGFDIVRDADRLADTTSGTARYRASYVLELMAGAGDPGFDALWHQTRRAYRDRQLTDDHGQTYLAGMHAYALRGQHDQALQLAREGIRVIRPLRLWHRLIELSRLASWPVAQLGMAARSGGDAAALDAARAEMAELLSLAQECSRAASKTTQQRRVGTAAVAHIEAELGRLEGDADMAAWDAVAAAWSELGRPYRAAYARWRAAEAAAAAEDRAAAGERLRAAHATATELGALPMLEHLEGLARRLRLRLDGGGDREAGAEAAYGLTPREREVLVEVAAGKTNREIAAALFISESTAGVHVSNILGKLGVSTRTEAARVALDEELVSD